MNLQNRTLFEIVIQHLRSMNPLTDEEILEKLCEGIEKYIDYHYEKKNVC